MPEQQLSSSRKRQRSERPQPIEMLQPASKKQRFSHPSGSQPPAAFWDKLSKIWLTKRALRELDRRNARASPNPPRSPYRRVHRPATRNFLAQSKRNRQTLQHTADYLRCCNPRTLKDVKLFSRHGGPDLSDLRNYPESIPPDHTMNSNQLSSQSRQRGLVNPLSTKPTTTKTKSTGVYDRDFEQHLIDYGVYHDLYEYPDGSVPAEPNNWEDINQILARPRPSLSQFSNKDFKEFKRADHYARKEKQVSELVLPIIEGKIADARCRSGGVPFTNLDPLTDGTLTPGNPDVYYGARPEQLTQKVLNELGGYITPLTQHNLPIVPNFFLAAKGPDESYAVTERQACYNGALGARGLHSLQSYGRDERRDEPVSDNNAYTITSLYYGGALKIYTSHPAQPTSPRGQPEYHMNQINTWGMTGNVDTFRQGATAYRNARDWAKEQRDEAIRQANERANRVAAEAPALAGDAAGDASGSLNEEDFEGSDGSIQDSAEHRVPAKRSRRQQPHAKRRNTDVSGAEESDGSAVVPGGLGRERRGGITGCADSIPQA
ncbi:uncharacterized protein BDZ99DRAFT_178900 [Mytilinidion resinicola]|uniref:Uncharacterized protein n=1 Tax=Mytilinidion resinicola TaxID=574789 RepID=A0A6A6Y2G4_9PEZI|nr:uncharacterized protein BDZ99DRAFT_178900 [Mytilinidion resinicola]KAF2803001.1 hypothetical protein BDZ99DRAFT_178900 [Mytilinidion resinicola]